MSVLTINQGDRMLSTGNITSAIDKAIKPEIPQTQDTQSFMNVLASNLNEVNELQQKADQSIMELATGKNENLHETMINVEKAEISLKLLMSIRNKMIEAYREVMRMGV